MIKWKYECYDSSLSNNDFLIQLYEQKTREIFARIIALDINELPIDRIEGKVTGGSINIDGDSSVRRSCSLSLVTEDININDFYWGLKTKFKLEIGLKNNLTNKYRPDGKQFPDIVWFKGGTYLISSFNTSISVNSCSISLQGKDKMCLLNGDLSGEIFASVDFGTEEYQEKILIKANPNYSDSNSLITQTYYYKININKDNIHQNDSTFMFIQDKNGQYWKNGNVYKRINNEEKSPKYQIYKIAETPKELFEEIAEEDIDNFPSQIFQVKKFSKDYFIAIEKDQIDFNQKCYKLKDLYIVDYEYSIKKIPLEKIIREGVHAYAQEPYHNIIIKDLDNYGLEQLSYKGDQPLYALRDYETKHFVNLTLNAQNIPNFDPSSFHFDNLVDELTSDQQDGIDFIIINNKKYSVAKIEYGDDLGYRITELTYTGDLITSIGENFTSVLDKIKNMLGNFEYFYDIDGKFIFQEKKNYINTAWSQLTKTEDETYINYSNDPENKKVTFNFESNILITALNNTPVLNNVKNDYSVWGKRKGISGAEIPIHARYAIDKKPIRYQAFDGNLYISAAASSIDKIPAENYTGIIKKVDWRELIYQMAKDYFAGQGCSEEVPVYDLKGELVINNPDHFLYEVGRRNPQYYPTGITGYEQYYTDMEGFWRQLYNPDYIPELIYSNGYYEEKIEKVKDSNYYKKNKAWVDKTIKDINIEYFFSNNYEILAQLENYNASTEIYNKYNKYCIDQNIDDRIYWNVAVFEAPETLNFWIEFLDSENELAQFSVPVIGTRSKAVNEDKASAIFFRQVPDLILFDKNEREKNLRLRSVILEQSGYTFVYLPKGFSQFLNISYRSMSIKNKIDQLLYQFGYCIENISITALPIYSLQPNTRIYVRDNTTKINGEYIVTKITIPLVYNGVMSITANKAPERLY